MKRPLISVVIPTYNRSQFISHAIDSVLSQTFTDFELIVIDDGSTDNTQEIILPYQNKIKYFKKENQGVSSARNLGIVESSGKYIAFLDSDDYWLKTKLEAQINFFDQNQESHICQTEEVWFKNGKLLKPNRRHKKQSGWIFENCLLLCLITPSAVMIKKEIFDKIGLFDETLPVCEDYDMWLRISSKYPVGLIDEYLTIKVGGHEDQLSHKYNHLDCYRVKALEKIVSKIDKIDQKKLVIREIIRKINIILHGLEKKEGEKYNYYCEKLAKYENMI